MVLYMLDNGKIIKDGEKVNNIGQMVLFMKDFGVHIQLMEKVD